jgi:DICT domain-containing protein
LAARCPLVAALGLGLATSPAPGVHGASLSPTDPLVGEWTVTVIGPHYSGALIARDLGDKGPDQDRRFEFVVTHDRDLVLGAARSLMSRITTN